jgi:hypothetical protein
MARLAMHCKPAFARCVLSRWLDVLLAKAVPFDAALRHGFFMRFGTLNLHASDFWAISTSAVYCHALPIYLVLSFVAL